MSYVVLVRDHVPAQERFDCAERDLDRCDQQEQGPKPVSETACVLLKLHAAHPLLW
jgi:hypothetical protein